MREPEELPLAPLERLLRREGAERVSEDACKVLGVALEDYSRIIARKAKDYSAHAKRKTIKAEDIELALRDLNI